MRFKLCHFVWIYFGEFFALFHSLFCSLINFKLNWRCLAVTAQPQKKNHMKSFAWTVTLKNTFSFRHHEEWNTKKNRERKWFSNCMNCQSHSTEHYPLLQLILKSLNRKSNSLSVNGISPLQKRRLEIASSNRNNFGQRAREREREWCEKKRTRRRNEIKCCHVRPTFSIHRLQW